MRRSCFPRPLILHRRGHDDDDHGHISHENGRAPHENGRARILAANDHGGRGCAYARGQSFGP